MTQGQQHLELAERFFRAIEDGDIEAVAAAYDPAAPIWHNHDCREQSVAENLAVLEGFIHGSLARRYRVIARHALDDGFVQQHVLEAESHHGNIYTLPACIVCRVRAGRIVRLDEYFDSAQVDRLVAGLSVN